MTASYPASEQSENRLESGYQSWPRSRKETSTSGILMTQEQQLDGVRTRKSLDVAPGVNLSKEGTKNSVEAPPPTNSSLSDSIVPSSQFSSFQPRVTSRNQCYVLGVPVDETSKSRNSKKSSSPLTSLPFKYQPVITVIPKSGSVGQNLSGNDKYKSQEGTYESSDKSDLYASSSIKPNAQSTPEYSIDLSSKRQTSNQTIHSSTHVMVPNDPNRQNSLTLKISNCSGYVDRDSLKSAGSLSSLTSSDDLSITDNTIYTSSLCSSPNLSIMDLSKSSTPYGSIDSFFGSVDSLLDMRKTPTNELEKDSYQINVNYDNINGRTDKDNRHVTSFSGKYEIGSSFPQSNDRIYNCSKQIGSQRLGTPDYISDKPTPDRWSIDSSEDDLTRVTTMSSEYSMGSIAGPNGCGPAPIQPTTKWASDNRLTERQSRSDQRKEPSYRNHNATNRRSLPSDVANSVHIIDDIKQGQNQNIQAFQKTMSSSKSCTLGFNSVLLSNSSCSSKKSSANSSNHIGTTAAYDSHGLPQTLNGEQISSRFDSYCVAMGNNNQSRNSVPHCKTSPPTKHNGHYRVAMDTSPNRKFNAIEDDAMSRADSYRIAVRNTNGIVPELPNRNTSYRSAISDDIPSKVNVKLDALSMENIKSTSGRDVRRMGITDVDQVKELTAKVVNYNATVSHSQVRARNKGGKTNTNSMSGCKESRSSSQSEGIRIRKVTTHDVDPIEVVQTVDKNSSNKKLDKNSQNRSSTYIQFDPIFEDADDFPNVADLDMCSLDYSKHLSNTSKSQFGLINGMIKDAESNNLKTTKQSKLSRNIEMEDNYRFSQV